LTTSVAVKSPTLRKPVKSEVIVQKLNKDYKSIENFVNRNMLKAFSKMFFLRPKSDEVECESINLCYESFLFLNVKYHLEYYRNRKYRFNVDDNVVETTIFDRVVDPVAIEEKSKAGKEIVVEGKELVIHENNSQFSLDRKGRSINLRNLPQAKDESDPIGFLDSYATDVRHLEVSIPEILKKIVKKMPEDLAQVIKEYLEITSQTLIYTPVFEARVRNLKSHEIKIIPISGVTGKIFSI
jgi:hypothetical protein